MTTEDGIEGMERCAEKAERVTDFSVNAAQDMVLNLLQQNGYMTGEDLVISCREAGHVPHDDRAFGPVLAGLSRAGLIRKVSYGPRLRGHGTAGAITWTLAEPHPSRQNGARETTS